MAIVSYTDLPYTCYELPLQVYGILDISDGNGGPYQGTANIVIYGTKQNSVPIIVGTYGASKYKLAYDSSSIFVLQERVNSWDQSVLL